MLELHHLLRIKQNIPHETIKKLYHKQLFALHPTNKHTGCSESYLELQDAYKRYVCGDSYSNCFAVVHNDVGEIECRCGGIYFVKPKTIGRLECEHCSCFLEVEEPYAKLGI
ncbi:hypothetical protein GINT2_001615 [Glugoides intestinalis]